MQRALMAKAEPHPNQSRDNCLNEELIFHSDMRRNGSAHPTCRENSSNERCRWNQAQYGDQDFANSESAEQIEQAATPAPAKSGRTAKTRLRRPTPRPSSAPVAVSGWAATSTFRRDRRAAEFPCRANGDPHPARVSAAAGHDSPAVAQAWLTGVNPELGDRVPLRLMRENEIDEVAPAILSAVRAYLGDK